MHLESVEYDCNFIDYSIAPERLIKQYRNAPSLPEALEASHGLRLGMMWGCRLYRMECLHSRLFPFLVLR